MLCLINIKYLYKLYFFMISEMRSDIDSEYFKVFKIGKLNFLIQLN